MDLGKALGVEFLQGFTMRRSSNSVSVYKPKRAQIKRWQEEFCKEVKARRKGAGMPGWKNDLEGIEIMIFTIYQICRMLFSSSTVAITHASFGFQLMSGTLAL